MSGLCSAARGARPRPWRFGDGGAGAAAARRYVFWHDAAGEMGSPFYFRFGGTTVTQCDLEAMPTMSEQRCIDL